MSDTSTWSGVGAWLKRNGRGLVGLAGAVATGNVPAGVMAVASMVSEATGETDPARALQRLQADPETLVRLEEIAQRNESDIRHHHRELFRLGVEDAQHAHTEQQQTIRAGDAADDLYVRHTRPQMARQSWYATMAYVIAFEAFKAMGLFSFGAVMELALILLAPAAAYLGFRSYDKSRSIGVEPISRNRAAH